MKQCDDCQTFKKADNCIKCGNEAKNRELDMNEKYVILKAKYENLEALIKKVKEETDDLQSLASSESERMENAVKALKELLNGN